MKLSNLPKDIEEEILSRVPIKSLRLLRSAGKLWYHHPLFKDPRFIRRHSNRAPPRKYHEAIVLHDFRVQTMNSYVDRQNPVSELSLIDPVTNRKVEIAHAFHCDGLLLCTATKDERFVAWDPFSGKTRWIQPPNHRSWLRWIMPSTRSCKIYALGYDNKELCHSYKILRVMEDQTMEIYEFKSDSWRKLDGVSPCGSFDSLGVSLKGNAYWISRRGGGGAEEYSLLEFDFSTERFQNLYLPFHEAECLGPYVLEEGLNNLALSVVGEDRLCLFYESAEKSKTEIWMSTEIGEIGEIGETASSVSWSKYLTVSATPFFTRHASFFVDDEMKLATCFYNHERHRQCLSKVRVFGDVAAKKQFLMEDGTKYFGWRPPTACGPIVFGYLPCLD
ncbi:unnamed protein product [Microthlaspi erraticum]|uniref:F-box domain-containing protein n=1 Tax=Microthlaspi erraticum TaxID=1685480 RepID=A0A6D2LK00_9BRAS|nr:unnamed protein product [Microthlaspi erraticum]